MSELSWNCQNLPLLGRVYLRNVRKHMRGLSESFVQLGETGNGTSPNYQVTLAPGKVNTYRGLSHKSFEDAATFLKEHISRPFSLLEIDVAIEAAKVRLPNKER